MHIIFFRESDLSKPSLVQEISLDLGCCSFKICNSTTTPSSSPPKKLRTHLLDKVWARPGDPRETFIPNIWALGAGFVLFITELQELRGQMRSTSYLVALVAVWRNRLDFFRELQMTQKNKCQSPRQKTVAQEWKIQNEWRQWQWD